MADYNFKNTDLENSVIRDISWDKILSAGSQLTAICVRLLGALLMLIGLAIGLKIISEAWDLYRNPQNGVIERFAKAIEDGSHLDQVLKPRRATQPPAKSNGLFPGGASGNSKIPDNNDVNLRLSYFVAWFIVLLLLLVVARLALAAVKIGGELALYDMQFRKFVHILIREAAKDRAAATSE